jgi:hypothetical protein
MKMETAYQNLLDATEALLKQNFTAIGAYIKKAERLK